MDLHQDAVHLTELVPNQGAAGPRNVADVVLTSLFIYFNLKIEE